jgi:hypothetical protein
MSFDLMAEGVIDYELLAASAPSFQPLELFPIPAAGVAGVRDAIGIACPSSRCGPSAAQALDRLVRFLWDTGAVVHELWRGRVVSDESTLAEAAAMIAERAP